MVLIHKIGIMGMILFLMGKSFVIPFLLIKYEFSKDFIIENYCVNKNRPELHCDGKCYLANKIKEAKEQDRSNSTSVFVNYLIVFELVNEQIEQGFNPNLTFSEIKVFDNFKYLIFISSQFLSSAFHPPQ